MVSNIDLKKELTIFVCSCDAYSDLWDPFFTLLHKYWPSLGLHIVLNTEKKDYAYSGLDIYCAHSPKNACSYGERMLNALDSVKTEFVLVLLDDFFIRSEVKINTILSIINWMKSDKNIACFSSHAIKVYSEWETDKYYGFRRLPYGNKYMLSLQAGIWRKNKLKKYWRKDVSPWEWEEICNVLTTYSLKDKFYALREKDCAFINYGQGPRWWGVFDGKWCIDDVKPLFDMEGIQVDFSKRGIVFSDNFDIRNRAILKYSSKKDYSQGLKRCLGIRAVIGNKIFKFFYKFIQVKYEPFGGDYIHYLEYKARVVFCKKIKDVPGIIVVRKKDYIARVIKGLKNFLIGKKS